MKISDIKNLYNCVLTILISTYTYFNIFPQGQSGKISGIVIDASTKEPLIGANVLLEGTNFGAATNVDGKFVILNISPGTYNISASMIGYTKVTENGVEVYIDRTTQLSFGLNDEALQMEQVVVVAKRPAVIKDQTSTSTHIDDKQIKVAPIEGLRGALELSAGFQKDQKGNYSVRGSGSYELNFQINGVEQMSSNTSAPATFGTEKADNSWKYDVNPLGVQQLQLITGGFSAEYGNSQAGVVKVVLKMVLLNLPVNLEWSIVLQVNIIMVITFIIKITGNGRNGEQLING